MSIHVLTLQCPDRPGIVASIADGLLGCEANILENHQFGDLASALFCMRTKFESPIDSAEEIERRLSGRAIELGATLSVRRDDERTRVLVMVSREEHCLVDLLQRWADGELAADIAVIVSNHPDQEPIARRFGVDFVHIPITTDTKPEAERALLELIEERNIEVTVLARYMQILSADLARELHGRVINIHHSFLPGFKGAKPYHQAWERGVKLIGATAHFVTADLDEGPIIAQDVVRVTHADSPEDMVIAGKDVERSVLSRAIKAYVEGRVFLLGDRTVVFG